MTSPLTPVTDAVTGFIAGSILPAVLNVLGSLVLLVVSVWGSFFVSLSLRTRELLNLNCEPVNVERRRRFTGASLDVDRFTVEI